MRTTDTDPFDKLVTEIAAKYKLGAKSIHGPSHWRRVNVLGARLALRSGADETVVALFACLHDSQREDEFDDPLHGARAARYVQKLYDGGRLDITPLQLEQLTYACLHHSEEASPPRDVTITTCWDADRLDLYRLGIEPDDAFLHTDIAKSPEIKEFARNLASW